MNFIERIKELTQNEDTLTVSRDVNELKRKFDDYILTEEGKIQVESLNAKDKGEDPEKEIEEKAKARLEALMKEKDVFYEIYNQYRNKKQKELELKNSIEQKNLTEKRSLIAQLKDVVDNEKNIGAAFAAFKEIQEKWKSIGDIPREKRNEIQKEYSKLLEDFYYNIKIYKQIKEHDFHRNAQLKESVIKRMKELNLLENIKEVESKLKLLQNEWNDIGPVPNEEWEKLKDAYWTEVRSVYNKINRYYEDKKKQLLANLEKKKELLAKTKEFVSKIQELNTQKAWEKATKKLLEIQEEWKNIGFGPRKENEEVWKEFRSYCDQFFDTKKEFYGRLFEQFKEVEKKKKTLIEKAKELQNSTEWKATADKLKRLQSEWKKAGSAGPRMEQRLWKEFRGACDAFFNAREEFFKEKDKELLVNYDKKKELIEKIKSYVLGEDKKQILDDLKSFTKQFNEIGFVPRDKKDEIYSDFKSIMDQHYKALNLKEDEKEKVMFEAEIEMLKSSGNASKKFREMRSQLRRKMDKINKEIQVLENNLGFFGKGAESMKNEVEKKIQRFQKEIDRLKKKLKLIPNE